MSLSPTFASVGILGIVMGMFGAKFSFGRDSSLRRNLKLRRPH
jgi:hypothetical protein